MDSAERNPGEDPVLDAAREALSRRAEGLDPATRARLALARRRALAADETNRFSSWRLALPALAVLCALLLFPAARETPPPPEVRAETFSLLAEPEGWRLLELAELDRLLAEEEADEAPRS
jgi:hypothetical protein